MLLTSLEASQRLSVTGLARISLSGGFYRLVHLLGASNAACFSSRGNFFLTWQQGDDFWIPHNRATPRRIQSMGFVEDDLSKGLWMSLNGGLMQFSSEKFDLNEETPEFEKVQIKTGG